MVYVFARFSKPLPELKSASILSVSLYAKFSYPGAVQDSCLRALQASLKLSLTIPKASDLRIRAERSVCRWSFTPITQLVSLLF